MTVETDARRRGHAGAGAPSWREYGVRFLFGGIITAAVGVIAQAFGPVVAGLFLAFPAILPASLTLVAKHDGKRGAEQDATGAAMGGAGLIAFGAVVWLLSARLMGGVVLASASMVWFAVSALCWLGYRRVRHPD